MLRSRRRRRTSFKFGSSRILLVIAILAAGVLSYKVYAVSYEKYQINKQISSLDAELRALSEKSGDLSKLIGRLQDKDEIEKEARKKLNLMKEGEKAVIITGNEKKAVPAAAAEDATSTEDLLSNPKKWFDTLFR